MTKNGNSVVSNLDLACGSRISPMTDGVVMIASVCLSRVDAVGSFFKTGPESKTRVCIDTVDSMLGLNASEVDQFGGLMKAGMYVEYKMCAVGPSQGYQVNELKFSVTLFHWPKDLHT